MAILGYLLKSTRALGLAFNAYFQHNFSIEMFLFITLTVDKVSMSYLFFSQNVKQNITSYLDN